MNPADIWLIGFFALFISLIIGGYVILIYNGLVNLTNNIDRAWSNVDVLLKQRNDEGTKLVAVVKVYMTHEKKVFENVTKARSIYTKASSVHDKAVAHSFLTGALKTLFAFAENYPELKANENFLLLQRRLTGLENEIADRREFYNYSVTGYNIRIQSFPDIAVAKALSYRPRELFKLTREDEKQMNVGF
jgi:LemA protein